MRAVYLAILLMLSSSMVSAQELRLKREPPKIAWPGCPQIARPDPATPAQRQEAERLVAASNEASILGDNNAALDLLTRAATRDPSSERVAYRRARTLEALNRRNEAVAEYCRYMAIAPTAADAPEVRQRISALTDPGGFAVPAPAATAFAAALAAYDAGRLAEAETALGAALELVPAWGDALYDRGVVRLALGRRDEAAGDLRRYLELNPGSADFNDVIRALGPVAVPAPPYRASTALATGLLLPGLGHFTTGRPMRGLVFLGAAAAAVTTGFLVRRVEVDCLAPPTNGRCPSDQVVGEEIERPYLVPALGAAVVVGVLGAIDAFVGARRLRGEAEVPRADTTRAGASIERPAIEVGHDGARLNLIRLRF